MQTDSERKSCLCVVGSLTRAMRAQRILTDAAIFSAVEKVNSATTGRGCAYGVSYPCSMGAQVRELLRQAGIRWREGGG